MNLAVRTGLFCDQSLTDAAHAIAAAGYDAALLDLDAHGAEFGSGDLTPALAGRIADVLGREDIALVGISADCDLVNGREAAQERMIRLLALAEPFGTDVVVAGNGRGEDWTDLLERLREVLDEADEHEVSIAIELAPEMAVRDLDHAELLLDAVESDLLGLALDPLAVAVEHDIDVREVFERVGDALLMAVISEVDEQGRVVAPSPRSRTDFGELFDLLGEYVPDVTVLVSGVTAATAAVTRSYLARLL